MSNVMANKNNNSNRKKNKKSKKSKKKTKRTNNNNNKKIKALSENDIDEIQNTMKRSQKLIMKINQNYEKINLILGKMIR